MNSIFANYKVFTANSNPELAEEIAAIMGKPLGDLEVKKFSDGEISVNLNETVRGVDCFVIQSTCNPVNDNLMELLITIDAMKRASAGRISAVVPYYGYARQDRKAKPRDPITAKLVADMLVTAGADRIITMDLHAAQIQGYFTIPVDHLIGMPLLINYFAKQQIEDMVIVSPDHGSVPRARNMAEPLEVPIAIVDKRRPTPNVSEIMNIIGDIEDKNCILVDDMIDTAGTITNAANALKQMGAKSVRACATHGVLSGPAIERIETSEIEEVVLLNTMPIPEEKRTDNMKILSVGAIFAEALTRVHTNESVSKLFDV
ncbi:MAG: ribose-phosphate diphosphokinase [Lentihominibacter sp.]